MITPERLVEYRHIAPTAGPEGQKAINELLAEVEARQQAIWLIQCGRRFGSCRMKIRRIAPSGDHDA